MSTEPHVFSAAQRLYVWLTAASVACLLIADVVGIKLFRFTLPRPILGFEHIEHTCGMLTFPITFLLTDLVNEYYGKKAARRLAYVSFSMALVAFAVMNIAQAMPFLPADFNISPEHFNAVFGSAKIMYVASVTAYLIGQLSDIAIFGAFKRLTRGKAIWLRATGSTVFSQMIDSFVVSYIAFGLGRQLFPNSNTPPAPFNDILKIAATGYTLKFVIAIAITPLIYLGHSMIHRWVGMQPVPADAPIA